MQKIIPNHNKTNIIQILVLKNNISIPNFKDNKLKIQIMMIFKKIQILLILNNNKNKTIYTKLQAKIHF